MGWAAAITLATVTGGFFLLGGNQGQIGTQTGKSVRGEPDKITALRERKMLEQEEERRKLYLWYAEEQAKEKQKIAEAATAATRSE